MNLRDFLEKRELELLERIATLRSELVPLEGELAEIRRAKTAVGSIEDSSGSVPRTKLAEILASSWAPNQSDTPLPLRNSALLEALASPYASLTMKELIVKALDEQFPSGATTRQMLDFFRDAWGRDIERQNLSPQLSRLFQEGVIGRIQSLPGWFLVARAYDVENRKPYRDRQTGDITYMFPEHASEQYEELVTRETEPVRENLNKRKPYRLRTKAFYQDRLHNAGETVWLLPHEVGAHHEPIEDG
jgi:hypothetical protein